MVEQTAAAAMPATADPERLDALLRSELLDSGPEEAFDRIARLAERMLDVPVVLVTLVDKDRQYFKSEIGLAEPWASKRQTPLEYSFCRYSVTTGAPLVVDEARENPLVSSSPSIDELGIEAYAGYPIRTNEGHVLGNLCVIDSSARTWLDWELDLLGELTALVETEVRYRLKQRALSEVEEAVLQVQQPVEAMGDAVRAMTTDPAAGAVSRRRLDVLLDRTARVEGTVADMVASVRGSTTTLGDVDTRADLCAHVRRAADLATRSGDPDRLVLDLPDEPVFVMADREILARGLSHLLVTGLAHLEGDDDVTVRVRRAEGKARLEATLPGRPLAPGELARLVTRLHHALEPSDETEATLRSEGRTIFAEDPPVSARSGPGGTTLTLATSDLWPSGD